MIGLTDHTLRYYEREGLLTPLRDKNDRRIYNDNHVKWLQFINKMRNSHMPLAKIKIYNDLYAQGDVSIKERRELLVEHHNKIKVEIESLKEVERFLQQKVIYYDEIHDLTKK